MRVFYFEGFFFMVEYYCLDNCICIKFIVERIIFLFLFLVWIFIDIWIIICIVVLFVFVV